MSEPNGHTVRRRPPLRLPFEKKEFDIGTWSYDHRVGICITLIVYLVFGILFIVGKISLNDRSADQGMIIDFREEPKWELTPEQQRILSQRERVDYSEVRNATSNDNAEQLDSRIRDDRGTEASQLYEDAGKLAEAMRANRELYEAGLAQAEQTADRQTGEKGGEGTRQDTRVEGSVTVRFSFTDPVRSSVNLIVPAYLCEGGGVVELSVTLDINGKVTSATVNKHSSSRDECMQQTAVNAAQNSRFNVDPSAPARHRGTITYTFIPQ